VSFTGSWCGNLEYLFVYFLYLRNLRVHFSFSAYFYFYSLFLFCSLSSDARRVDSSPLVFRLSSHRHSYIVLVFSSRFID